MHRGSALRVEFGSRMAVPWYTAGVASSLKKRSALEPRNSMMAMTDSVPAGTPPAVRLSTTSFPACTDPSASVLTSSNCAHRLGLTDDGRSGPATAGGASKERHNTNAKPGERLRPGCCRNNAASSHPTQELYSVQPVFCRVPRTSRPVAPSLKRSRSTTCLENFSVRLGISCALL